VWLKATTNDFFDSRRSSRHFPGYRPGEKPCSVEILATGCVSCRVRGEKPGSLRTRFADAPPPTAGIQEQKPCLGNFLGTPYRMSVPNFRYNRTVNSGMAGISYRIVSSFPVPLN
jgi:hypothetical protein